MNKTTDNDEQIDEILLDLVHEVSSIRAGKTFVPTDYTDPVKAKLSTLLIEARLEELEKLKKRAWVNFEDIGKAVVIVQSIDDHIKQLEHQLTLKKGE